MPTHEEVITGLRAERDALYADRNRAVQLAAALAQQLGQRVGVRTDPDEPDWPVLMIDLPDQWGQRQQVAWHLAREDMLAGQWDAYPDPWDGHSDEEKATRIRRYVYSPPPTGHEVMTDRTFLARVFHMAHNDERLSDLIPADTDDDPLTREELALRMAMMALMLAMYEVRGLQDDTIDATNPGRRIYKVVNSIHDDWERLSRSFDEMRVARGAEPWLARW